MAKKRGPTPKRTVQHPQKKAQKPGLSARTLLAALVVGGLLVGVGVFALARNDDGAGGNDSVDAGPVHVHGLGINPANQTLMVATHTGTYRVAPNAQKAERVGKSRQDTMGFTVAGPNYFLGSGHPDIGEAVEKNLPPLLGLIESRDAGATWQPVSLSGEADFHVLRFAGRRVYGYDASNDRLLVSRDKGRTWTEVRRPAPLLDLAVDPTDADRAVATGAGGLYLTRDGGRTWKRLALTVGLLGWPSPRRLYLVDANGSVLLSTDVGKRWATVGSVNGQPAAFLAQNDEELYVALHDGTIEQSKDAGRSWSPRSIP
jgi:hypothetical protein